jgi:branched-chain amino acid transport system ATP-binding protein
VSGSPESLRIENLSVSYGDTAVLENLHLSLQAGEVWVLLGPNGAGKSTLFNAIAGTAGMACGTVHVGGKDITHLPPHRRAREFIARSFQIPKLAPDLTGHEHLLLTGQTSAEDGWGIGGLASRTVSDMTHAERKLLEVATTVALNAPILLLDEPSAGADAPAKERLIAQLSNIGRLSTTLIIEHDIDFITRLALPVLLLFGGRISYSGTIDEARAFAQGQGVYF